MNCIGLMEGAREIIHQRLRARVAMGLKQHVDALKTAGAGGGESGADFRWVMSVIVDHGDAALCAAHLKAAVDATEFSQRLANHLYWNVEFESHCDSRRSVESIMRAGDLQAEATKIAIAHMQM